MELEMIPKTECLRCGGNMVLAGSNTIRFSDTAPFFGGLVTHLLSDSLEVEIMICQGCRKVEFYTCE